MFAFTHRRPFIRHIHLHSFVQRNTTFLRSYHVRVFGDNWLGTTGLDRSVSELTRVPQSAWPGAADPVISISSGWGHSGFVSTNGVATLIGLPLDFRNTLKHINTHASFPLFQRWMQHLARFVFPKDVQPLQFTSPIVDDPFTRVICSVAASTALLTRSGKLFMVGQNFHGQCGTGSNTSGYGSGVVYTPEPVVGFADDEHVVHVALGFEHSLAVTNRGALYAWGRGDRGQLGSGDRASYSRAVRVCGSDEGLTDMLQRKVTHVAAGFSHSACITSDGALWVWGKMQGLQVKKSSAIGDIMEDQLLPRRVTFENVYSESYHSSTNINDGSDNEHTDNINYVATQISAGQAHFACATKDGGLWMLGMRGRGREFDDSAVRYMHGQPAVLSVRTDTNDRAPLSQPVQHYVSTTPPVPELHMQTQPYRINVDGYEALPDLHHLRSSTHHSYYIAVDGSVYRFGWAGRLLPVNSTAGVRVVDLAFGYCHAIALCANDDESTNC